MGTGNALIKNWDVNDESLYKPETFYVDLSPSEGDINDELENNRIEKIEEDLDETKAKIIFQWKTIKNFKKPYCCSKFGLLF